MKSRSIPLSKQAFINLGNERYSLLLTVKPQRGSRSIQLNPLSICFPKKVVKRPMEVWMKSHGKNGTDLSAASFVERHRGEEVGPFIRVHPPSVTRAAI